MSVPFCRTKCSYCNFASDVFSRAVFERYIDRVCEDMDRASAIAVAMGGVFENEIDSVYIGGGTPSILEAQQFERLFVTARRNFRLRQDAEITVECAPGTLTPAFVDTLVRCGVPRSEDRAYPGVGDVPQYGLLDGPSTSPRFSAGSVWRQLGTCAWQSPSSFGRRRLSWCRGQ